VSPPVGAVPVHAYAFATTFRMRELTPCFPGAEVTVAKDELSATFPDGASAIAFDFGAVVFFGGADATRTATVAAIARSFGETQAAHTEEFLVEVAPDNAPEVRFDRVVVRELSAPVREVVGLLLAQSAAMDYYEDDVAQILARSDRIMRDLAERGRIRGRVSTVVKFIGACIQTKNDVVETLALFDKPEVTWEEEPLDRLFVALRTMLEIDDRFRALEYRLREIQDNLVLLVDLSQQRSTLRLDVMILLLILVELVVMIYQVRGGGH
jgi:uncharacterized Rmd1/YagE family protein